MVMKPFDIQSLNCVSHFSNPDYLCCHRSLVKEPYRDDIVLTVGIICLSLARQPESEAEVGPGGEGTSGAAMKRGLSLESAGAGQDVKRFRTATGAASMVSSVISRMPDECGCDWWALVLTQILLASKFSLEVLMLRPSLGVCRTVWKPLIRQAFLLPPKAIYWMSLRGNKLLTGLTAGLLVLSSLNAAVWQDHIDFIISLRNLLFWGLLGYLCCNKCPFKM